MNKLTSLILVIFFAIQSNPLQANSKPAYKIYTGEGKEVDYDKMIKDISKSQVILFGELHNNPIAHWLQLEVTKSLFEKTGTDLILSAEMFESDDQIVINEYLQGLLSDKTLNDEAKLWSNYETDYKPLLDFAKSKQLKFICANVPRRYANLVYNHGTGALDSLTDAAKLFLPPLPFPYDAELTCYKEIVANAGGHGGENLPKSQALKDATMGWWISQSLEKKKQIIHFNGSYHSDRKEGVGWYILQYAPKTNIMNITTKEQEDINQLAEENKGSADYIIVVDSDMTKTY